MPKLQMTSGLSAVVACLVAAAPATALAVDMHQTDVRGITVGTMLDGNSAVGLTGFACADQGGPPLPDWTEYRTCPADAEGLRRIHFEFEEDKHLARIADRWEGTKLAGHPVILSMSVADSGMIEALRIVTDSKASPYLRKKAFLLSLKVRDHYGPQGWMCRDLPRQAGETEIGGMFVKQECTKSVDGRALRMQTNLFRGAGQEGKTYEDSVSVLVTRDSAS